MDGVFRKRKTPMIFPLLKYLGKISKPEHSEYGFNVEYENRSVRLLVLTIANAVFLTNQLMVQEAPDLCYQKVLTDLKSEAADQIQDLTLITGSDIEHYRDIHPILKRKSFRKSAT
jgi:hypothetical protein